MADYYPLVAKAVAGLEKNTGEGRRLLYERARSALVAQLRGMNDPPLTEAEITRERLALEEAIRKVEAEAARRGRDAPRPEPPAPKPEAEATPPPPAKPASAPAPDRAAAPLRPRSASRSVTEEGMKGFRDVIAEAEALGDATAQGAKTAREAYAATPPSGQTNFERVEPRVEP
jgi:pyruvate/2-oxoglutarate dehydrogenase complex dihydrolipoamide acyltransferase (E2) component